MIPPIIAAIMINGANTTRPTPNTSNKSGAKIRSTIKIRHPIP
jgi:hypothetical protein